mmetsp:Transcript_11158/g.36873  ORF Transcript_11158/g.36873 Transcript_11158/m.36873 type:complete len:114 (+) Transcript_11158:397-738(+)
MVLGPAHGVWVKKQGEEEKKLYAIAWAEDISHFEDGQVTHDIRLRCFHVKVENSRAATRFKVVEREFDPVYITSVVGLSNLAPGTKTAVNTALHKYNEKKPTLPGPTGRRRAL